MTHFEAFWQGMRFERSVRGGPDVLYGEARDAWAEVQESYARQPQRATDAEIEDRLRDEIANGQDIDEAID